MSTLAATQRKVTRVLIAEDDALVARDVEATLQELGYHVSHVARTAQEAVEAARRERPDLALLDIRMPGDVDGIDAGKILMGELGLAVIYLTAYGDETTLRRAMSGHPYGYVLKPFQPRELRSAIEIALARRDVEGQIRASEERFLATLLSIGEAVISTDPSGRIRLFNPGAERLTGLSQAEAAGRSVEEVLRFRDPETGQLLRHPVVQALSEARVVSVHPGTLAEGEGGATTPVSDSAAPIVRSDGGVEGCVLVVRDHTDLHEKERALRESEERFRQIAERIDDVFWISSPGKDRMDYVSPAYEKVWGRPAEELLRDPMAWAEHVHPDDRARVLDALPKQPLGTFEEEYRILRPDGEVRWIWDRAFPVEDESGEVVRIIGVAEDVTERVALERRMAQGQKMEAVGRLAGGIAHDFNNLLTVIRSQSDLLLEDLPADSPLREEVELIQGSAERAAKLTSQLLAFSRDQMLRPRVLDLSRVVAEMGQLLDRLLGESVQVEFALADGLPPVEIDANQLEQAVMNLAVNARDAMAEGGTLTLSTALEEITAQEAQELPGLLPGTHVTLRVADTGSGMDEATRSRIFEPFFTTKPTGKGTGLGLAMVYGVVKQSGGAIHVESAPGRGSEFFLRFPPARTRSRVDEDPGAARDDTGKAGPHPASGRVLLVEDDESVRSVTRRILERAGFEAVEAADAEAALEAFRDGLGVDLLVTDLGLPGMNGSELIHRLRRERPDLPAVAVSGYARGSLEGGELPEDVAFLAKPFTHESLLEAVRSRLGRDQPG